MSRSWVRVPWEAPKGVGNFANPFFFSHLSTLFSHFFSPCKSGAWKNIFSTVGDFSKIHVMVPLGFIGARWIPENESNYQINLKMKLTTQITILSVFFLLLGGSVSAQTFNEVSGTNSGTSILSGDYNVLYGDSSGVGITSGSGHVMIGTAAGKSMTTQGTSTAPSVLPTTNHSLANVFVGHGAGRFTISLDNVFIGSYAGWSNSTGSDNTFIGAASGFKNTLGFNNTFLGHRTGSSNTNGNRNTFLGTDAGESNVSGDENTFVGNGAGKLTETGFQNTFVGNEAGYDNVSGFYNTAVGDSAMIDNSVGSYNTMVGHASGAATEWTSSNTFVGDNSGWDNNRTNSNNGFNAHANTYLGARSGQTNRDGAYNVVIGENADFEIAASTFGNAICVQNNYNVAIGSRSEIGSGGNRMVILGTWARANANNAVAVGDSARNSGAGSIAIGSKSVVTGANSIAIGAGANVTSDNQVYLGNSAIASIGGVVNWTATSDQRFKANVEEDVVGLEFVKLLRPVTYNMDAEAIEAHFGRELPEELKAAAAEKAKVRYTGFLAQEVEFAAEAAGYDFSGIDRPKEGHDAYGIRYAEFVVPLVKAIQEQQEIIEGQKKEIAAYESALMNLHDRVNQMEVQLMEIAPQETVTYTK